MKEVSDEFFGRSVLMGNLQILISNFDLSTSGPIPLEDATSFQAVFTSSHRKHTQICIE